MRFIQNLYIHLVLFEPLATKRIWLLNTDRFFKFHQNEPQLLLLTKETLCCKVQIMTFRPNNCCTSLFLAHISLSITAIRQVSNHCYKASFNTSRELKISKKMKHTELYNKDFIKILWNNMISYKENSFALIQLWIHVLWFAIIYIH